jgi:hypothetical protein
MEDQACTVCQEKVSKTKSYVHLDCGHDSHFTCYKIIERISSYCIKCKPVMSSVLGSVIRTDIKENSLAFGDDHRADEIIKRRIALLETYGGKGNRVNLNSIKKSLNVEAPTQNTMSILKNALNTAINFTTRDENNVNRIENMTPLEWIGGRLPSPWIMSRGGDGKNLMGWGVTTEMLFANGYDLEDFLLLRITWDDMLNMGFKFYDNFKAQKNNIDFKLLTEFWSVTCTTIIYDVCGQKVSKFSKLKWTVKELKALKFDFTLFHKLGIKKKIVKKFTELKLPDWKDLGVDLNTLRSSGFKEDEVLDIFNCTDTQFYNVFGFKASKIEDKNKEEYVPSTRNNGIFGEDDGMMYSNEGVELFSIQ